MTGRAMAARSDETGTSSAEGNSAVANGDGPQITGVNPMTDTTNNAWEGPAYEYGVTWGPDAVDTTEQQVVTVAQEDREAAAKLFGFPAWENIMYVEDRATSERVRAAVLAFARHRLASVSSASAEPKSGKDAWYFLCERLQRDPITSDETDTCSLRAACKAMLAFAASPEPVPATNQAGEVSVDDALAFADQIAEQHRQRANLAEARIRAATDCLIQPEEGWQAYTLRLRAALATQPATSQEGEAMALIRDMAQYAPHVMPAQHGKTVCDDYARAAIVAATPTPPPATSQEPKIATGDTMPFGLPLNDADLTRLYEGSKYDALPVGSEVRQLVSEVRYRRATQLAIDAEAVLTSVQRAALKGAMFIAGNWVLTTRHEDHPDIIDGLPENIADPVSGVLTPLGCALRAALATQPATSQEGEALAMARRCQQARHSAVEPVERDNVLNEAATMLRRLAATPHAPLSEYLLEALQPFADCVEQIDSAESDEEWAKFRLLIRDYRRAATALALAQVKA